MAKQSRFNKGTHVVSHAGKGATYEQSEIYDDSLLPDSQELKRLIDLDPDVMNWIKKRTEIEQDSRIKFNDRKMKIIEGTTKKAFIIDMYSLSIVWFIIISGMLLTGFLIYTKNEIGGSIFGAATLLIIVNSILNFRKNKLKENINAN